MLPGIWRLDGHDPALPAGDLEPLRQIIGKASVVGLGEAVHTSGGFYQMKDRVFRFLVEGMGFRAFAIESPWTNADRVSAYVQSCEGSPEEALKGLFGVWQSTEVRDLVQWMCEWNRAHPKPKDRLQFYGFDIQQGENDRPALIAFLERTGVAADSPWIAAIEACTGQFTRSSPPVSEASYAQCTAGLEQIDTYFQSNAKPLAQRTSKRDLEIARLNLAGLRAWEEQTFYLNRNPARSSDARDEAMAHAFGVLRSLRAPKAKTVVWAHNYHLAKGENDGGHPMGLFLAREPGPLLRQLRADRLRHFHRLDRPRVRPRAAAPPQRLGRAAAPRPRRAGSRRGPRVPGSLRALPSSRRVLPRRHPDRPAAALQRHPLPGGLPQDDAARLALLPVNRLPECPPGGDVL